MSAAPVRILPPKIDWDEAITPEAVAYAQYTDPTPLCPACGRPAIEGSLCTERNANKPLPERPATDMEQRRLSDRLFTSGAIWPAKARILIRP